MAKHIETVAMRDVFGKLAELAQILADFPHAAAEHNDVPALTAAVLEAECCGCWLLDDGLMHLRRIGNLYGRAIAAGDQPPETISLAEARAVRHVLSGPRFRLPHEPVVQEACSALGLLPGMIGVLCGAAGPTGILYLRLSSAGELQSKDQRDALQLVTIQVGLALERSQADERRAAAEQSVRLALVQQTAHALAAATSAQMLCEALAELIHLSMGRQIVGIYLRDGSEMRLTAARICEGETVPAAVHVIPLGQGIIGHVAVTGIPYYCPETRADPHFFRPADVLGTRCEIAVPFRTSTSVIGVINVESTDPGSLKHDDLVTLGAIADQAGIALQNVRLYEAEADLRRRAEARAHRLEHIQRLGERLKLDLDEREIGHRVVRAACEAINFRMAVLNLIDRPGHSGARARVMATVGLPAEGVEALEAHDFPQSAIERLFRPEFRLSRSYFIPVESGLNHDTEVASWIPNLHNIGADAWRAGDELLVPLTDPHAGHLVGFLSVDDPENGRRPEREDVEILEIFADQAIVALRNAHLLSQARYQAEHDPVTGLLNHRAANDALSATLALAQERSQPLSLIALDVDNFKLINDTHGHLVGDNALRHVARLLQQCVRATDPVARLGGDEFLLILPGVSVERTLEVVRSFLTLVHDTPLRIEGAGSVPLRLSAGVAICPDDALKPHALLAVADSRLYEAKRAGGETIELGVVGPDRDDSDVDGFDMISALVAAVDNKDRYTREHSDHVAAYACALADVLGLSSESQRALRIAGLLHDVGKIGVPDRILRKPGSLEAHEWEAMRQHVTLSSTLLRAVGFDADVLAAVAHHHERWDGGGYPSGLAGSEVPLLGRIMILADAAAAMIADRPYRAGLPLETIISEVRKHAGRQFDPELTEPFIAVLRLVHLDKRAGVA